MLHLAGLLDVQTDADAARWRRRGGVRQAPHDPAHDTPGHAPVHSPGEAPLEAEVESRLRHDLGGHLHGGHETRGGDGLGRPDYGRRRGRRRGGRRGRRQLDGRGEERLDLAGLVRQLLVGQQGDDEDGRQGEGVQQQGRNPGEDAGEGRRRSPAQREAGDSVFGRRRTGHGHLGVPGERNRSPGELYEAAGDEGATPARFGVCLQMRALHRGDRYFDSTVISLRRTGSRW